MYYYTLVVLSVLILNAGCSVALTFLICRSFIFFILLQRDTSEKIMLTFILNGVFAHCVIAT